MARRKNSPGPPPIETVTGAEGAAIDPASLLPPDTAARADQVLRQLDRSRALLEVYGQTGADMTEPIKLIEDRRRRVQAIKDTFYPS
jgi:hypothetical protein